MESGAVDALGFGDRELALACASHSGELRHVRLAEAMLASTGQDHTALECGCQWPMDRKATIALAQTGQEPTSLYNNCSGKHAGFICTACHLGINPSGYINYDHPIQTMICDTMTDLTGGHFAVDNCGTDGCSIPTYAVPLPAIAHGFAKMATGNGLEPIRAQASNRIISACMNAPEFVAGTGRACTRLMKTAPGRLFAKTGAEGVFCAVLPKEGLAIALKCDDGTTRAAEAMVAALCGRFLDAGEEVRQKLHAQANRNLRNWNAMDVGSIGVTDALN